jgi:hypothetical protein
MTPQSIATSVFFEKRLERAARVKWPLNHNE